MLIPVSIKLIDSVDRYLQTHNLGRRGFGDGNSVKQRAGLIGEVIVHKLFLGKYPDLQNKPDEFDDGFDFEYKTKLIDVKTMERKYYTSPTFVNNFYRVQVDYKSDTIVFCSFNSAESVLEVCGWIPKKELLEKSQYYPKGTERSRTDGTSFKLDQDNYEIENKNLYNISTLINIQ